MPNGGEHLFFRSPLLKQKAVGTAAQMKSYFENGIRVGDKKKMRSRPMFHFVSPSDATCVL